MSNQTTLDPRQIFQQQFTQLSSKYKGPIRQIISETEEVILNMITQITQQQVNDKMRMEESTKENIRLRELLEHNNIDSSQKTPQPNRAERRTAEKKKN